jgi:hypothetical protein
MGESRGNGDAGLGGGVCVECCPQAFELQEEGIAEDGRIDANPPKILAGFQYRDPQSTGFRPPGKMIESRPEERIEGNQSFRNEQGAKECRPGAHL